MSLFRPGYILDKFSPKFENKQINAKEISSLKLDPSRDVHIKVTRRTEYGDRYRLFVIEKKNFENQYSLEDAGIILSDIEGRITVDNLKWNGIAKKMGVETGDVISQLKIENLDRPNKAIIYPFSLITLFIFGYFNYRRTKAN